MFFENLKITRMTHGETKALIMWKTNDRTAKGSIIWDSRITVQHKWDTFGFILCHFGVIRCTCDFSENGS